MELAASLLVLFTAAALQGLTGFGYSLLSLPLLAFFMPVRTAVPMLSLTSIFLNLLVFVRARRWARPVRILPLLAAGAVSIPAGVWVLNHGDQALMKSVIGILVILSASLYLSGFRIEVRREWLAMIPVGILSGLMNGMTTFSGPPVILFLANQQVEKQVFRANLALYFLVLNLVAVPVFLGSGLLTSGTVAATAVRFPAVLAGALAGIGLAGRVDETGFRRTALVVLALLGLLVAGSGLGLF
jgi:uncharacterized membrane protein YfcA